MMPIASALGTNKRVSFLYRFKKVVHAANPKGICSESRCQINKNTTVFLRDTERLKACKGAVRWTKERKYSCSKNKYFLKLINQIDNRDSSTTPAAPVPVPWPLGSERTASDTDTTGECG